MRIPDAGVLQTVGYYFYRLVSHAKPWIAGSNAAFSKFLMLNCRIPNYQYLGNPLLAI